MMAEMTLMDSLEDGKILTMNDPACGSGRMTLGAAKVLEKRGISPLCMQVTVQDFNSVAVDMAYINLTLWGIPTKAIVLGKAAPTGPARLGRHPPARGTGSVLQSPMEYGSSLL